MSRIVDLSWPLGPDTPVYPGDPACRLEPQQALAELGLLAHVATLPSHCGTHVDAPAHVIPGGPTLADLALSRFAGRGVRLDLTRRPGLAVTAADLAPHLPLLLRARPAFALLQTGDETRFGAADYFTHGAYLDPEAARLLVELDALKGVGLDAASPDPYGKDLPAHRALLGCGRVIIENLRGLAKLPESGFFLLGLPLLGRDGSPIRAAALVE